MGEATRKIMEGIDKKDVTGNFFLLRCRRVSLWIRMEKALLPGDDMGRFKGGRTGQTISGTGWRRPDV